MRHPTDSSPLWIPRLTPVFFTGMVLI